MADKRPGVKLWPATLEKLRELSYLLREKNPAIIDRLVTEELAKVQAANNQHNERGA